MNQAIALILILAVWAALMAAYIAWERIRDRRKRDRFDRQITRYRASGGT